MAAANRGLFRYGTPQQPGAFPWRTRINGQGLISRRPVACNALLGFRFLATDNQGGTEYLCQLVNGRPAWIQMTCCSIPGGTIIPIGPVPITYP
jgi:hypothetical protein